MKISDLSKQHGVTNAVMIKFLKEKGFKASSHMQTATEDMVEAADEHFSSITTEEKAEEVPVEKPVSFVATRSKTFSPDDIITCRSVTPWKLTAVGLNGTVYHWEGFGDKDYVSYKDLQSWRRKDLITKPKIIIEDPDLCEQWKREIGEVYKPYIGVDYPEELFEKTDDEFVDLLKNGSDTLREVVKVTAINMIKNENYPTLQKIKLIDDTLGTCIKEFI